MVTSVCRRLESYRRGCGHNDCELFHDKFLNWLVTFGYALHSRDRIQLYCCHNGDSTIRQNELCRKCPKSQRFQGAFLLSS